MKTNNKDILDKFRNLFNKVKDKFGRAELSDGSLIEWVGELEEGSEVFLVVDDGLNPLEDGSYELMDGRELAIAGGVVEGIEQEEVEAEEDEEVEEMESDSSDEEFAKTELVDGTVVEWDSEELKVGDNIYVVDEEGERSPAPNGNHETVEGLVVSVEDGIVEELDQMESEAEEEVDAESNEEEEFQISDSDVREAVDAVIDLIGGTDGPMDEDGKDEVVGILTGLKDKLEMPMGPEMEEDKDEVEMDSDEEEVETDSVELDMDIQFDDTAETKETKEEFDEDSNPEEEEVKDMEKELDSLKSMVTELSEQLKLSNERLEKISKEPAVEKDNKKTVANNFNKTKTKSRAAQILASGN